jgi:hypothetical protein
MKSLREKGFEQTGDLIWRDLYWDQTSGQWTKNSNGNRNQSRWKNQSEEIRTRSRAEPQRETNETDPDPAQQNPIHRPDALWENFSLATASRPNNSKNESNRAGSLRDRTWPGSGRTGPKNLQTPIPGGTHTAGRKINSDRGTPCSPRPKSATRRKQAAKKNKRTARGSRTPRTKDQTLHAAPCAQAVKKTDSEKLIQGAHMKDSKQGTTDQWCTPYSEQENQPSDLETAKEVTQPTHTGCKTQIFY